MYTSHRFESVLLGAQLRDGSEHRGEGKKFPFNSKTALEYVGRCDSIFAKRSVWCAQSLLSIKFFPKMSLINHKVIIDP